MPSQNFYVGQRVKFGPPVSNTNLESRRGRITSFRSGGEIAFVRWDHYVNDPMDYYTHTLECAEGELIANPEG